MQDHASHCEYTNVVCPMDGCEQVIPKAYLDDHMNKCDFRKERCIDCGELVTASRIRVYIDSFFFWYTFGCLIEGNFHD